MKKMCSYFPISGNVSSAIQANNNAVKCLTTNSYKYTSMILNHAALGWRNALSSLMTELRLLENQQWPLSHDHEVISTMAEMQPVTIFGSSPVHSSQHAKPDQCAKEPSYQLTTGFVFAKLFKIHTVKSPQEVETTAACVMFNAALTQHLAGLHLHDDDSSNSIRLHRLLEAENLYRLVLTIIQKNCNEPVALNLFVIALNNYAAVLAAMGPFYANKACDTYQSLFHHLSQISDAQDNHLLLDESDMNNIYSTCLSVVFQVSLTETAPAA